MQISQLLEYDAILPTEQARMLIGDAGLGKSSIVKMIAQRRGMGFVDLRLSELEPADLVGMPYVDRLENGVSVTRYAAPEWWHKLSERPTILFLDEIDRAREDMQPLAMQLTLDRRAGGRSLPADTIVFAAGNGLKYQTTTLDQALCNRFAIIDFTPSVPEWTAWASDPANSVHQAIVQFITENSSMLDIPEAKRGVPNMPVTSRRSWAFLGRALNQREEIAKNLHDIAQSGNSLLVWSTPFVGDEAAIAFSSWVRDNYKPLNIQDVLDGKVKSAKGFTLPQLIDALGPLNEIVNEDKTTEEQRVNALTFYANFSSEAFAAFFERLDEKHAPLIQHPKINPLVKELVAAKMRFNETVKQQREAREANKTEEVKADEPAPKKSRKKKV